MSKRITLNILLFASVLYLPWWVAGIFAFTLVLVSAGYEIIFWGLMHDSLYAAHISTFFSFELLMTVLFLLILFFVSALKKHLVFYDE